MKKKNYLLAILLILSVYGNTSFAGDPVQYGTPYTGVPDPRNATIYQVNIRSFSSTRDLPGVIARLSNIKALGVNVIYLMPIQPVSTSSKAIDSPYSWKSDNTAVDASYGTLAELQSLVTQCHNLGMAVILDWTVNQTGWDHPWITAHPTWYVTDNGVIQDLSGWTDVAALNFSNAAMCDTMIQCMRNWVFTGNVDGFRCDDADNPPDAFWEQCITSLRSISTHKILMLGEGSKNSLYTDGFDYIFGDDYYYDAIAPIYQSGSAATLINTYNTNEYVDATGTNQVARYLSNHDVYASYGSPFNIFGGTNGTMAAFVTISLMKSVPFIYNGMEVGNTVAIPFPYNTTVINWTENVAVTPLMTQIIGFRNSSTAVRQGTLTSYTTANICAFKKVSGSETVFVISNLRNASETFTLPSGIANTTMYDAFLRTPVVLGTTVSLSAYQYMVLTTIGGTYYQIENRWQSGTYLKDAGTGKVTYGTSPASTDYTYQWKPINMGSGYIQLQNLSTGNYMNIQDLDGSVDCGAITQSWYSAQWSLLSTGDGWDYIVNRWETDDWIHIQDLLGYAEYENPVGGYYSAEWQLVNGTEKSALIPVVDTIPTPILEPVVIYPNPAINGVVFIKLPSVDQNSTVKVFDITGKQVLAENLSNSLTTLRVSNLKSGFYIFKINTSVGTFTQKIEIIQ